MPHMPAEFRNTIHDMASDFLDQVMFDVFRMSEDDRAKIDFEMEDLRQKLLDLPIDDTNAIRLSVDEQLRVLETSEYTENAMPNAVGVEQIRSQIEMAVCFVLHEEAMAISQAVLSDLEGWLENASFELSQVEQKNRFGWAVHTAEREDEDTTIYEYRNIEGMDVDVWHFRNELLEVFVCEYLT